MPFDNTPKPETYVELRQLHDLLLDKSKWPTDFKWQFNHCSSCAMGLLLKSNGKHMSIFYSKVIASTAKLLKISELDVNLLFGHFAATKYSNPRKVTPKMVAADIKRWLATS